MIDLLATLKDGSNPKRWLLELMDRPPGDWCCVIWPFTRAQNGYPMAGEDGVIRPHRIMCEWRHGPAPSPKHQAAHSCGRGDDGCVNPWHLNWRTPAENQDERYQQHGHEPRRKLTPEQVDEIRAMHTRERTVDTAKRFGVSEANIRQIQSGKTWRLESRRVRQFTSDEVALIRSTPWQQKTARQWAAEFAVHEATIDRIRRGASYKYFPMPSAQRSPQESASD